jgi:Cytochrome c7 and related cytochrome c
MKMRTACLALLPALLWPLSSCQGSPPKGPPVPPAEGTVVLASMGPANFPHEKHATEFEIECVKCHHETNAKPLSIPHMEYFNDLWIDCGTCHHKAGAEALGPQACSSCHHAQNGDIADETLSAKVVIHKNCWSCHEVGQGASASATCKTCHTARS